MIINATIKNALLVGVLLVFYQMTSFAQSITTTFSYTGAMQTWTVPAGVTSVNIEVFGAQGNAGIGPNGGGAGAMGGKASGDLAVVPGQILNIFVGGSASGQTGGYNGGGNGGGLVGPNQNNGTGVGGGGGGASDVRTGGTALSDRIIVGGGGGGGGVAGCEAAYSGGVGGNGGGGNGAGGTSSPNGGGGSGGTLGAGGIEGIGCSGFLGTSGSLPNGGHGQACCCFAAGKSTIPAGGGGGGGFVQGGGGGGGSAGTVGCSGNDKGGGGGGGGGSSYVGGVTAGLTSTGVQSGNGKILITYTIPLPTIVCPPSINVITDEGLCGARICYSSPVASSSVAPVTPAGFFFVASYNNSYYYQSTSYFNYADAQAAAVAAGGHLAVITSAAENNAINAGGGGFAWLGGNDLDSDGIWKWSNCETNSYSNFCAGEPNGSTFENYLEFETGGCWNDLLSNAPRAALVEIEGAILSQTSGYPQNALFPVGTTTNTFVATNSAGATTCSMTITVTDTESPKAICKNISRNLNPTSGMRSIVASDVDNGSSDNCTVQSIAIDKSSFNCTNVGANTVILTVTDNSANTQTCAATVTISYASAPVAKCRNAIIALSSAGNGTITGAGINNNSTDLCLSSGLTLSLSKSAYNCSNLGPNTVTLTVTNVAGNSSTCTGTVTVKDLVKPVAKCKAAAATVPPGGTVTVLAGDVNNGSTDACTSPPLITLTPNTFTCANSGANTVILTVKDGSNNVSTCSAIVTITCGGAAPQQSIGTPAFADYTELMDLFPNPAADKVNIRLNKSVRFTTPVQIFDNTGRVVYTGSIPEGTSLLQVDLNQHRLTSGMYLVSVKLADRVQTKSLVIFRE